MAKKRKLTHGDRPGVYPSTRDYKGAVEPHVDAASGQRCALPGIDGHDLSDGDLFDETSLEAIAYLRSVRLEAKGIPDLLLAPDQGDTTRNDEASTSTLPHSQGGFYLDGAYIGLPRTNTYSYSGSGSCNAEQDDDMEYDYNEKNNADEGYDLSAAENTSGLVDPQRAYHSSLLNRFVVHRSHCWSATQYETTKPDLDPATHPTYINRKISAIRETSKWIRIVQTTNPRSMQVAEMSQDTVLWLLERVPAIMKRKRWIMNDGSGGRLIGMWIWALLGKLAEPGTLSSEEISVVRELGKRAGAMIEGLRMVNGVDLELDGHDEESDNDGEGETGTVERCPFGTAAGVDGQGSMEHAAGEAATTQERAADLDCEEAPETDENNDSSVEAMELAKARLMAAYVTSSGPEGSAETAAASEKPSHSNGLAQEATLRATLDMILTVVGEFYGQRDLLIDRDWLWERSRSRLYS